MKKQIFITLATLILAVGCVQKPLVSEKPPENLNFDGVVDLKIKPEKGQKEVTTNCSHVVTETYEDKSVLHQRIEDLDFKVKTVTREILPNGNIVQDNETIQRDGPGSLRDLAYPELGEVLQVELSPKGQVQRAGNYPKDSIFYLPSIPLPDHAVREGEEWVSKNTWRAPNAPVSLLVELKLKAVGKKQCGEHTCVNVLVSGEVHFPVTKEIKTTFSHTITGRFLFDQEKGLVPWSEFASLEQVQGKEVQAVVHSKLRSELVEPRGYRTPNREEPTCPFETTAK